MVLVIPEMITAEFAIHNRWVSWKKHETFEQQLMLLKTDIKSKNKYYTFTLHILYI